jgi:malate dehydrogenase (oxaloacetate-decarboxylating)(NADP+)
MMISMVRRSSLGRPFSMGCTCSARISTRSSWLPPALALRPLACLDLLVMLGIPVENIWVTDIKGLVYEGRVEDMDEIKARYAKQTDARTLGEVIADADVFLGLSAGGVLKKEMVAKMAPSPLIMALANPNPEILPEDVKSVRSDAIMATGRSDYPNQVNNVLCFPFIFRGAP